MKKKKTLCLLKTFQNLPLANVFFTESCQDLTSSCPKVCPWGYRTDAQGCSICKCQRKQECQETEMCEKTCLYGYQMGRNGCMRCKCQNCPALVNCNKQCTHGLERDDRGCEICKCKGTINVLLVDLFLLKASSALYI